MCRRNPARPGLKTCKPCVDDAISRRDGLKRKRNATKGSVKTSAQLADVLRVQGFEIQSWIEEDVVRGDDALVEVHPNIVVQISWKRVVTADLTFGPDGFLTFGVPTPDRIVRTPRPTRDYAYGVSPTGHTYGVTVEPRMAAKEKHNAEQIGYYDNLSDLVEVVARLVTREQQV